MSRCDLYDGAVNARKKVCCFVCSRIAHGACITEAVDIINLLGGTNGLAWRCNHCIENSVTMDKSSLNNFIASKVDDALSKLTQAFDALKSNLVKSLNDKLTADLAHAAPSGSSTYSEIAKSIVQPAVIIKSKNPAQTNTQTKSDMLQNINPAESDFQLVKVKHVRDGGVLVSCRDKSETERLMKMTKEKLAGSYEIKATSGVTQRIRISGFTERLTDDALLQIIRKCNASLFSADSECSVVRISHIKKDDKVF